LTGEGPRGTTFYAIAVNGARLKTQFSHHLQRLPSRCAGAAASGASVNGLDRWLNQLDGMIASNRERVAWSARRVD
jgi:hypothetical protein